MHLLQWLDFWQITFARQKYESSQSHKQLLYFVSILANHLDLAILLSILIFLWKGHQENCILDYQ